MKNKAKITLLFILCLSISSVYSQESANTSGGDATGTGGTAAFSIGQVAYTYESGSNGNTNQGVQQAYEIFSVGIDEQNLEIELSIYPNPTSENLQIEFEEFKDYDATYQLLDLSGKLLLESKIQSDQSIIDMSTYQSGVYFLNIVSKSENNKSFKILKK